MLDCIIIGAGPAGLSAALYLLRKQAKLAMVAMGIGGQIADAPTVENYPGLEPMSGLDIIEKMQKQVEDLKLEIKIGEVKKISKIDGGFEVEAGKEKLQAKTVLIASGKSPRKLGVPGEDKLQGKGISTCVTCDGPLFKDKPVAVLGGGNSAIAAALELDKYASKVYVLNLGENLIGEQIRIDQLEKSDKVEIIGNAKTTEVVGDNLVSALKYEDLKTKETKEITVQGIFVEIGWVPSTGYLKDFAELTPAGEIKIDRENKTSIEGIYAAGDATDISKKQMIIACGEGAKAALYLYDFLTLQK